MQPLPPDAFLSAFPPAIRDLANRLREIVRRAAPDAVERVRPGWRLIGYDIPVGRRSAYFAYVAPEVAHVHLGFEHGTLVRDPASILEGAHLNLRQVRYVTFRPGDSLPSPVLADLVADAARIAAMTRSERLALVLDRDAEPTVR